MSEPVAVVALVRDLMDRSRFEALTGAGHEVRLLRDASSLGEALGAALAGGGPPSVTVVVDLAAPDALQAIADSATTSGVGRVVAFGSHVDRERLDRAADAGAVVLARSAFFSRIGDVVRPT